MNTAGSLNYQQLCELIATNVSGATAKSVDGYLRGIYKTILRQLELNQKIVFQNFGRFELKERKGGEREINIPSRQSKYITYVEPKFIVTFKPSSVLDFCINDNNFIYNKRCETRTKIKKYRERRKERMRKRYNATSIYDLLNIANDRKEWIERNIEEDG